MIVVKLMKQEEERWEQRSEHKNGSFYSGDVDPMGTYKGAIGEEKDPVCARR